MIDQLKTYVQNDKASFDFSILIPSWNNLEILQWCISAIRQNSNLNLQIIVLVNEGKDGSVEWLKQQNDIDFIHSTSNIGVCYGLNACRSLVKSPYMLYLNDDMYVLPDWDTILMKEVNKIGHKSFMISATMIEPTDTGNACVVVKNFGRGVEDFNEKELLNTYKSLKRSDWMGSTWPPNMMPTQLWDLVGGLSTEFSPGMYSDPDFSVKLYEAGVRTFKGVGASMVYHFGSKSTKRVKKNKGRYMFIRKWGMTAKTFTKNYLNLGEDFTGDIRTPNLSTSTKWINKYKAVRSVFKK